MIKYLSFATILALRLFYQPAASAPATAPFTNPVASEVNSSVALLPAKLIDFNGSVKGNKVVLNWAVGENDTADQFIVEKSTDGKNYSIAALVFGTDKPETDNYVFYEKAGNQKVSYRIKLVNKNKKTEYSEVVEINPLNG
jgi:hypothetical protein